MRTRGKSNLGCGAVAPATISTRARAAVPKRLAAMEIENLLLSHTDDVLLNILSTLGARDLLQVELTHTRFAVKAFGSTLDEAGGASAAAASADAERWSLPQESARLRVVRHPKAQRVQRRGREPWLAPLRDLEELSALQVSSVAVRTGRYVDRITFHLSDGRRHSYGGFGGEQREPFILDDDERITELRCREGSALDQVQFITSSGRASQLYGGNGGRAIVHALPDGAPIAGLSCELTAGHGWLGPVPGLLRLDDAFIRPLAIVAPPATVEDQLEEAKVACPALFAKKGDIFSHRQNDGYQQSFDCELEYLGRTQGGQRECSKELCDNCGRNGSVHVTHKGWLMFKDLDAFNAPMNRGAHWGMRHIIDAWPMADYYAYAPDDGSYDERIIALPPAKGFAMRIAMTECGCFGGHEGCHVRIRSDGRDGSKSCDCVGPVCAACWPQLDCTERAADGSWSCTTTSG
jgi:hypothetical protein